MCDTLVKEDLVLISEKPIEIPDDSYFTSISITCNGEAICASCDQIQLENLYSLDSPTGWVQLYEAPQDRSIQYATHEADNLYFIETVHEHGSKYTVVYCMQNFQNNVDNKSDLDKSEVFRFRNADYSQLKSEDISLSLSVLGNYCLVTYGWYALLYNKSTKKLEISKLEKHGRCDNGVLVSNNCFWLTGGNNAMYSMQLEPLRRKCKLQEGGFYPGRNGCRLPDDKFMVMSQRPPHMLKVLDTAGLYLNCPFFVVHNTCTHTILLFQEWKKRVIT